MDVTKFNFLETRVTHGACLCLISTIANLCIGKLLLDLPSAALLTYNLITLSIVLAMWLMVNLLLSKSKQNTKISDRYEDIGHHIKIDIRPTTGDGNCFFHAAFGTEKCGIYHAENALKMREELYRFLNQFKSLDDSKMPDTLKGQLYIILEGFLLDPKSLTGKSNKIKELVEQTGRRMQEAGSSVRKLQEKLIEYGLNYKEVVENLKEILKYNCHNGEREYNEKYNYECIAESFINSEELYKAYLHAIKSSGYYIFIEEAMILSSLSNTTFNICYKDGNNRQGKVFKVIPDASMINKGYERNHTLWNNNEETVTIHLENNHYSRAIVKPFTRTGNLTIEKAYICINL